MAERMDTAEVGEAARMTWGWWCMEEGVGLPACATHIALETGHGHRHTYLPPWGGAAEGAGRKETAEGGAAATESSGRVDGVQEEWRAGEEAACGQMAGEESREAEDGGGWEAAGRAGGEAAGGAGGEAEVAGMEAANGRAAGGKAASGGKGRGKAGGGAGGEVEAAGGEAAGGVAAGGEVGGDTGAFSKSSWGRLQPTKRLSTMVQQAFSHSLMMEESDSISTWAAEAIPGV